MPSNSCGGGRVYPVALHEDDFAPSTLVEARAYLPDSERQASRTELPNGTVLASYSDEHPRQSRAS
jgi:hypothetical protein